MTGKEKTSRFYDLLLALLALLAVGLAIFEERMDLTELESTLLDRLDFAVWLIFAGDYFTRLFFSRDKGRFVGSHLIELAAILPFHSLFRGFRLLRLFSLPPSAALLRGMHIARLAAYFGRIHRFASRFLKQNNFQYVLYFTVSTVLAGAAAVRFFENMAFADALWWAFETVTIIGWDAPPSTTGGRIVAALLMVVGIGFISILTGTIASFLVAPDACAQGKNRNEFVAAAIKRLEDFENLSAEEVREIFGVLAGMKERRK